MNPRHAHQFLFQSIARQFVETNYEMEIDNDGTMINMTQRSIHASEERHNLVTSTTPNNEMLLSNSSTRLAVPTSSQPFMIETSQPIMIERQPDLCPICYSPMTKEDSMVTPCPMPHGASPHRFHNFCLHQVFYNHRFEPLQGFINNTRGVNAPTPTWPCPICVQDLPLICMFEDCFQSPINARPYGQPFVFKKPNGVLPDGKTKYMCWEYCIEHAPARVCRFQDCGIILDESGPAFCSQHRAPHCKADPNCLGLAVGRFGHCSRHNCTGDNGTCYRIANPVSGLCKRHSRYPPSRK